MTSRKCDNISLYSVHNIKLYASIHRNMKGQHMAQNQTCKNTISSIKKKIKIQSQTLIYNLKTLSMLKSLLYRRHFHPMFSSNF